MSKLSKRFALAAVLAAGLAAAPALYAQDSDSSNQRPMMMDEGTMSDGGMMGMMAQMNKMMEACTQVMQAMTEDQQAPNQMDEPGNSG